MKHRSLSKSIHEGGKDFIMTKYMYKFFIIPFFILLSLEVSFFGPFGAYENIPISSDIFCHLF